jgi:hypothetical protein
MSESAYVSYVPLPEPQKQVYIAGDHDAQMRDALEDYYTLEQLLAYATARHASQSQVTDEMVTRFLSWKLPQDFHPDAGISFTPYDPPEYPQMREQCWPIGTNLLTATQARAMLEHVVGNPPVAVPVVDEADDPIVGHKTFRADGDDPFTIFRHEPLRKSEADALIARCDAEKAWREQIMPTERDAISLMFSAWYRLQDFGWREAMYCPKDGSEFEVIEAGSTGIHKTSYFGTWPTGGCVDISTPVLFRALSTATKEG